MMKRDRPKLLTWLMLLIIAVGANSAYAQDPEAWDDQGAVLVGRISHVEGELMRYDAENDRWAPTPQESPFGANDLLQSGAESKAEFIMPNNTWIRIDADTQIQLVTLDPNLSELDLVVGTARFINNSTRSEIKSTTPFGHVTAQADTVFDLYVQANGVEVVAIKGSVYFMHNTSKAPLEVRAGSSAIFADINEVTAAPGEVKYAWNRWNADMDEMWSSRFRTKGASADYLPQELHSEAYPLDRDGVWEKVYYENAYYHFWRPHHVHAGWAPFTSGAWMVWHGDHVWIPNESFGYVTHHYGNWIFTAGLWYWAPPVTRVTIRTHRSLLRIGLGWYPGRVAWIHSGAHLGWIPLAPHEPYYTHRRWGRRSIVVTRGAKYHRHKHHRYKHRRHAVVIHRSHLYRASNYRHARIRSIPRSAIRKNFRTTPVLNTAVVKDQRSLKKIDRFRRKYQPHSPAHPSKALKQKRPDRINQTPSRHKRPKRITERPSSRSERTKLAGTLRHQREKPNAKRNAKKADRIRKRPPEKSIQAKTLRRAPVSVKPPQPTHRKIRNHQSGGKPKGIRTPHREAKKGTVASSNPGRTAPRIQPNSSSRESTRHVKARPYRDRSPTRHDSAMRQTKRSTSTQQKIWRRSSNHRTQSHYSRSGGRHRNRN